MYKKTSAVDLTDLAIGVMVLGIVVTIGALVFINLRSNRLTDLTVVSVANESLTSVEETGETLANTWAISVNECINSTDSVVINSGNYTTSVSSVDGTLLIQASTAGFFNNTDWNCTYTYYNTSSRADYQLANDAAIGLAEYGNWFDIIVIVGIAGLILALIFMAFGRSNSYESGVSY